MIAWRAAEQARGDAYLEKFLADPDAVWPTVVVADADGVQREATPEEIRAFMLRESEPPVGEWPAQPDTASRLLVTMRGTLEKVHVGIIPTDDWTTIPAHVCWGGWNACPHPGAPPQSRADALAREHYVYCSDMVDQSLGTFSALAAQLLGHESWSFRWD